MENNLSKLNKQSKKISTNVIPSLLKEDIKMEQNPELNIKQNVISDEIFEQPLIKKISFNNDIDVVNNNNIDTNSNTKYYEEEDDDVDEYNDEEEDKPILNIQEELPKGSLKFDNLNEEQEQKQQNNNLPELEQDITRYQHNDLIPDVNNTFNNNNNNNNNNKLNSSQPSNIITDVQIQNPNNIYESSKVVKNNNSKFRKKNIFRSIYEKSVLTRNISISILHIGKHIQNTLTTVLKEDLENKCCVEGFIKSGSIEII